MGLFPRRRIVRRKLTDCMMAELIERIEVFHAEKSEGRHTQRVIIHYNCVGVLEVPQTLAMPEITVQTRRGVQVTYAPAQATA
ncbi:MAG: DUF4368 domain-containing protein [Oscillospiraceae bacterium]|nr:DUF4368 domain-containing protein [Oscillospiraceae bacterium]